VAAFAFMFGAPLLLLSALSIEPDPRIRARIAARLGVPAQPTKAEAAFEGGRAAMDLTGVAILWFVFWVLIGVIKIARPDMLPLGGHHGVAIVAAVWGATLVQIALARALLIAVIPRRPST